MVFRVKLCVCLDKIMYMSPNVEAFIENKYMVKNIFGVLFSNVFSTRKCRLSLVKIH